MIRFEREKDGPDLLLVYTPENVSGGWLRRELEEKGEASISARVFHVTRERLVELDQEDSGYDEEELVFRIGVVSAGYYYIDRDVLRINFDLSIHVSISLERKIFSAERNISIFRRFNDFGLESLTIGGESEGPLPAEVFGQLLKKFPNSYELDRCAKARISSIIRNHLPIEKDFQIEYESYLNKKESRRGSQPLKMLAPYESEKFGDLVDKIVKATQFDGWRNTQKGQLTLAQFGMGKDAELFNKACAHIEQRYGSHVYVYDFLQPPALPLGN